MGMTLHQSLMVHARPFHLWVLCMDAVVEQQLQRLALSHVTLISLQEVETPELLAIKAGRNQAEYCWTLTPFIFQAVFSKAPDIEQVTYIDADLLFFSDPRILLEEFQFSQKQVLITEHAYAPEYDQSDKSGRFCVQFLTVKQTDAASKVTSWWQDRCLEWCFARYEAGKFGDQKYLDQWPDQFKEEVHILQQVEKTLGPWNAKFFEKRLGSLKPVFYHFHGLRIVEPNYIRMFLKYRVGPQGLILYEIYIDHLTNSILQLQALGIPIPYISLPQESFAAVRNWKRLLMKEVKFQRIPGVNL
jgi:hypothetical protein